MRRWLVRCVDCSGLLVAVSVIEQCGVEARVVVWLMMLVLMMLLVVDGSGVVKSLARV